MRQLATFVLLLMTAPVSVFAEANSCEPEDTIAECFERVYEDTIKKTARAQNKDTLAQSPNATGTPGTTSAVTDFLPRLIAALGVGNFDEGEGAQTLSFNLTPEAGPIPAILSVSRNEPTLFESMANAIPESIQSERKSALEDELRDFDDVEAVFSVNLETKNWGRSFPQYETLSSAVFEKIAPDPDNARSQAFLELMAKLGTKPTTTIADLNQRLNGAELVQRVIDAATAEGNNVVVFGKTLTKRGFFRFADLINNQPQLFFQASYRRRDDLTGPDNWSVKATYEHGFVNVNGLRNYCEKKGLEPHEQIDGESKICFEKYLDQRKAFIKQTNRIAVSLEYKASDSYRFELPADSFSFSLDSTRDLIGSAVYGRWLTTNKTGNDTSRIDLEVKYEDVSGDEMKNDRFVSTLTYTLDIVSGNVFTIGAVYANKPEYLGETDKELSARVGLKFKLDKKEKEES